MFRFSEDLLSICLPIEKDECDAIVENPEDFRRWLDRCCAKTPELFPVGFSRGYAMKDGRFPLVAILQCSLHAWLKIRDG